MSKPRLCLPKLFKMAKPCANCPFLKVGAIDLAPGRVEQIAGDQIKHDDRPFMCHKTLVQQTRSYCAGALIYLEKAGRPNIVMRLGRSLGMYDPNKFDAVLDTVIDPPKEQE